MILFYHPARRKPCLTFSQSWLGMGSWCSSISKPCLMLISYILSLRSLSEKTDIGTSSSSFKIFSTRFDGELVFGGEKEAFIYLEIVLISVKGCATLQHQVHATLAFYRETVTSCLHYRCEFWATSWAYFYILFFWLLKNEESVVLCASTRAEMSLQQTQ